MYFLFLSVGLDIALNPVFIFGIGPIPRLGIAGSAVATLLAQVISLGVLIAYLYAKKNPLCLHGDEIKLLKIDWSIVGTLVGKGRAHGPADDGGVAEHVVHDQPGQSLRYRHHRRLWRRGAGVELYPDALVSRSAWRCPPWRRRTSARRSGTASAPSRAMGVIYQLALTGTMVLLVNLFCRSSLGLFLPAGSVAVDIGVHLNNIVTWSFVFFGISMVLFGIVRANGAVIAPLVVLAVSLLGIPLPAGGGPAGSPARRCHLVELPGLIVRGRRDGHRVLQVGQVAQAADDHAAVRRDRGGPCHHRRRLKRR